MEQVEGWLWNKIVLSMFNQTVCQIQVDGPKLHNYEFFLPSDEIYFAKPGLTLPFVRLSKITVNFLTSHTYKIYNLILTFCFFVCYCLTP